MPIERSTFQRLAVALASNSAAIEIVHGLNEQISAANFGVVGDGVTDDTEALQKFFEALNSAGGRVAGIIPRGTYLVQDPTTATYNVAPLEITSNNVTIFGWGATLKIGPNGVGDEGTIEIQGSYNRIIGLTIDANAGVALATKDNTGFKINGTVSAGYTGDHNHLQFCSVINGIKEEAFVTGGEECFVITNGSFNIIESCIASDCGWQGYRTTGGHNSIINCRAVHFRGNACRVLDGEAVYIVGLKAIQTGVGGRSCILIDPGSADSGVAGGSDSPENDVDHRIDLVVIRDCYCINTIDGPDGGVNALKIAGCREVMVEGSYFVTLGSGNSAISLEDCLHNVTIRSCFISPTLVLRPVGESGAISVFQGGLNTSVSSASLNLDVDGDGVLDGAANYVVYTVVGNQLVTGKTIWVRGSSVTEYNGPQEVVARTSTTVTTNRKYVSGTIGTAAWAHSGVDSLNVIDCTFFNDQQDNSFTIENLNVPFANIENCRFRNLTSNTVKQSHINLEYTGDYAAQRLRIVNNKFYFRTTNICRAIRPTDVTTMLTSGKTICWGNELFNDRTSANVYLVDTYDSGDTTVSTYANRATIFNSDGDRLGCYLGTGKPTGSDVTFNRGDRIRNTTPSNGGAPGYVCSSAGAVGTWRNEALIE